MVDRITNEPVGSGLRRLGRRIFGETSPERRDELEAYRTQTPIDEIRRRRAAAGVSPDTTVTAPRAEVPMTPAEMPGPGLAGAEVVREMERRAAARAPARPNVRMSARRASTPEMSADDLNALSLARGEGESAAAANIRRRLAEMGEGLKKGGKVKAKAPIKKMKAGGMVKSSCSRGDGVAKKGKTKGRFV